MIGESPLKLRECRPAEIVLSVVESKSAPATDKGLALEHMIAPDTPRVLVRRHVHHPDPEQPDARWLEKSG